MNKKNNEQKEFCEEQKIQILLKLFSLIQQRIIFEGNILWQRFSAFLLAHSILLGFIGILIYTNFTLVGLPTFNLFNLNFFTVLIIILCIFGIIFCLIWEGAYGRISDYYILLIDYIKTLENKICIMTKESFDFEWHLYGGFFETFSHNKSVAFPSDNICDSSSETRSIHWWGRTFQPMKWLPRIIHAFILIYIGLIIFLVIYLIRS